MNIRQHLLLSVPDDWTNDQKGSFFEEFVADVLRPMRFRVVSRLRVTGMEIDLLAEGIDQPRTVLVECKAHRDPLPADTISKLLGNVRIRKADAGWLFSTCELSKDGLGQWEAIRSDADLAAEFTWYSPSTICDVLVGQDAVADPRTLAPYVTNAAIGSATLVIEPGQKSWILEILQDGRPTYFAAFDGESAERLAETRATAVAQKSPRHRDLAHLPTGLSQTPRTTQTPDGTASAILDNPFDELRPAFADSPLLAAEPLPPRPVRFIGRAQERQEFAEAARSLLAGSPRRQVFVFTAEGGMGKSTLCRDLIDTCQVYADQLFWFYVDFEERGLDSASGTTKLMEHIAALSSSKFSLGFESFRQATIYIQNLDATVKRLRQTYSGATTEEFETKILPQHLTTNELDSFLRAQLHLSRTFIADLIAASRERPIILFFDTYEVAQNFADRWMRGALFRYCLGDPVQGSRFIFVIAGRLSESTLIGMRDDVERRYGAPGTWYERNLDKFTPGDIAELVQVHTGRIVPLEFCQAIFRMTDGSPLGVNLISTTISDLGEDAVDAITSTPVGSNDPTISLQLFSRYLRHCMSQTDDKRERHMIEIITIAALPEIETSEIMHRLDLLGVLWAKLGILTDRSGVHDLLSDLSEKYSFVSQSGRLHPIVRNCIRDVILSQDVEFQTRARICEAIELICRLKIAKHLRELSSQIGRSEVETAKYRDRMWQRLRMDHMHALLWLERQDDAVTLLITDYIMGIQYGSGEYHARLLSSLADDQTALQMLGSRQRAIVRRLANLKEWLSSNAMEAEKDELLGVLQGEARIEAKLIAANSCTTVRQFEAAARELKDAQRLHREIGPCSEIMEKRLAGALRSLAREWSSSTRRPDVLTECLIMARSAVVLMRSDPRVHLDVADVLIRLGRFEEAKLDCDEAERLGLVREADQKRLRIREIARVRGYSVARQARILTTRGNEASAQGQFGDARRLYAAAIAANGAHISAWVKLIHLERNLNELGRARELCDALALMDRPPTTNAVVWNALASVQAASGIWHVATDYFQQAIAEAPDYINPRAGLGRVWLRTGRIDKALTELDEAWSMKKRSTKAITASLFWVHNDLGLAYLLNRQPNGAYFHFQTAEILCLERVGRESRTYQTWGELAIARLGQQKYAEAEDAVTALMPFRDAKGVLADLLWDAEQMALVDGSKQVRTVLSKLASLL